MFWYIRQYCPSSSSLSSVLANAATVISPKFWGHHTQCDRNIAYFIHQTLSISSPLSSSHPLFGWLRDTKTPCQKRTSILPRRSYIFLWSKSTSHILEPGKLLIWTHQRIYKFRKGAPHPCLRRSNCKTSCSVLTLVTRYCGTKAVTWQPAALTPSHPVKWPLPRLRTIIWA